MYEAAMGDDIWVHHGFSFDFYTGEPKVTDEEAYIRHLQQRGVEQGEVASSTRPHGRLAEAWHGIEAASRLDAAGADPARMVSHLAAAVAVLHPVGGPPDALAIAPANEVRQFVDQVRNRAVDWGARLLEEFNADAPESDYAGSDAARTGRVLAVQQRLVEALPTLTEALPLMFLGSMVATDIDHQSMGGKRILAICRGLGADLRAKVISALDFYEGRQADGTLPPALAAEFSLSWRRLDPARMPGLTREMFHALGLTTHRSQR